MEGKLFRNKYLKTYSNVHNKRSKTITRSNNVDSDENQIKVDEILTTKKAVEFILAGTLKQKVCRYCLTSTSTLSELDQILQVAIRGALYKVTIRDMIASFHPFKVADDKNLPNKICNKCLDRTISSYLFTQQCERAERALQNCLDDVYTKLEKLDVLDGPKKRGRQKMNPNYNIIYAEHDKVMDYAEPIIKLNNTSSVMIIEDKEPISDLECPKCWQLFPNLESLLNHQNIHPKTMWFSCRLCGQCFSKRTLYKRHVKHVHVQGNDKNELELPKVTDFQCNTCGNISKKYSEHLQHIEKHKFKMVFKHLIEKKLHNLCAVCLDKGDQMVELKSSMYLHGGYPELTGDRILYNILIDTLPEMHFLHNYAESKICAKCLDHATAAYIFINQTRFIKDRLNNCVSHMLKSLKSVDAPQCNLTVEISKNIILDVKDVDAAEEPVFNENDDFDDSKLKVEVLEDEFRVSDSESETNDNLNSTINTRTSIDKLSDKDDNYELENPAKRVTKTYVNKKIFNGYQRKYSTESDIKYEPIHDVCSEFLTFKKKKRPFYKCKFVCPLCNKSFISEHYLKRHILKHAHKKVVCTQCGHQFQSKFLLNEHKKMVHGFNKIDYHSCKICCRAFTDEYRMRSHEKCHWNKECHLCDKNFISQKYFNSHLQRHAVKFNIRKRRGLHTCSFCEKDCSSDNQLSLHVNKVHLQIKPYTCDMCEKQFYTEYNLRDHKAIHCMYSKEKCMFCDKKLKCRKDLVIHIRKHIGIKPHVCQICSQSFYSEINLKNHMRQCHGGRFPCKLCRIAFATRSELKCHCDMVHSAF